DEVGRVAPVALRLEVPETDLALKAGLDAGRAVCDLAGHELHAASRALVVEADPGRGVHAVALAIVDRDPVRVELGHAVGAAGMERRRLPLRDLGHLAEELARAGLVEADVGVDVPDGVEQARDADTGDLRRVDGLVE